MVEVTQHGDASGLNQEEINTTKIISNLLTKIFRKEIVRNPSRFNYGDDISKHINEIDDYILLTTITENSEKVTILLDSLDDDVKKEVMMTFQFHENRNDYIWIKNLLTTKFNKKISQATPLINILSVRQDDSESTEDFIRRLRIKAFDNLSRLDSIRKESLMLKAFFNGLRNKNMSMAIKELNPKTLDEAFELIKREKPIENSNKSPRSNYDQIAYVSQDTNIYSITKIVHALQQKIEILENKVKSLQSTKSNFAPQYNRNLPNSFPSKFTQMRSNQVNYNRQTNRPNYQNTISCYNCKELGHTSKECSAPKKCFNCDKFGHYSRLCPAKRRINNVNHIHSNFEQMDKLNFDSHSQAQSCDISTSNRFTGLSDEMDDYYNNSDELEKSYEEQYACSVEFNKKNKSTTKQNGPDRLVDNYVSYINGNGNKPRKDLNVINNNMANKPLISARFYGQRGLTLLDTGATCNLITKKFIDEIMIKSKLPGLKIDVDKTTSIRCANSSSMKCYGETTIPFSIGGKSELTKFFVVENLGSQQCILGLRSLKKLDIRFSFKNDCVFINNIAIPFHSKISTPTTVYHYQGNECQLNY